MVVKPFTIPGIILHANKVGLEVLNPQVPCMVYIWVRVAIPRIPCHFPYDTCFPKATAHSLGDAPAVLQVPSEDEPEANGAEVVVRKASLRFSDLGVVLWKRW